MIIPLVFLVGVAVCFLMAWCLGANDAANPTECAVGAGVIPMKKALILFAVFAGLGGVMLGPFVMKTIDHGIVDTRAANGNEFILGSFAAVLAAGTFLVLCTWKGMPTSTTHSIIGGVLGFGLIASPHLMRWDVISLIVLGLIMAPILSIFVAMGLLRVFRKHLRGTNGKRNGMLAIYVFLFLLSFAVSLTVIHKVLKWSVLEGLVASFSSAVVFATLCIPFFKRRWGRAGTKGVTGGLLIIALAFSAFAFGANDMGNATGAFVTPTRAIMGIPTMNVMFILSLLGAVGIAIGGFTWGHRVIKTSGFKITRLNPITGLSAEYSNALTILLFTVVPKYLTGFGLPISTTHSSIGSIMGVGLAQGGFASVNKFMTAKVLLTWALTIPCTALLSITFFKVFTVLLPLEA